METSSPCISNTTERPQKELEALKAMRGQINSEGVGDVEKMKSWFEVALLLDGGLLASMISEFEAETSNKCVCCSIEKLHHHWGEELAQTMKGEGLYEGVRFAFFGFYFAQKWGEREADCSEDDSDSIKCGECGNEKIECINGGFSSRKVSAGLKTNRDS